MLATTPQVDWDAKRLQTGNLHGGGFMPTSNGTFPDPQDKSPLERFLSLFTAVNAGEGGSAILLAINVFLLLGA